MPIIEGKVCAICGDSPAFMDYMSYNPICKQHADYKYCFHAEIVALKLGIRSELPDKFNKCRVCNCELTDKEKRSLHENEPTITCDKHKEVRPWLNPTHIKDWFVFKEANPNAKADSEVDQKRFYEWYHSKQ